MIELNNRGLLKRAEWEEKGFSIPQFDREKVQSATKENPFWIHFGAGNLFRAFQAHAIQKLLNAGVLDKGLIVAEGFDYEIVQKVNRPHDEYSILVTLKSDGTVEKTVVGSVMESCILDAQNTVEYGRLQEIFSKDSLQIVSFTITEKGYSLTNSKSETLPAVEADFAAGPGRPSSYLGKVAALLYTRYQAGKKPVAMVSMDNCSHNGDRLYTAINAFAQQWQKRGFVQEGFVQYIGNPQKVAFPWTMIDKITPRPAKDVLEILQKDEIGELEPVITAKNTYVAPFVNAEECEYLVIEDAFPNGRPPLEKSGFIFTDRQTVEKAERMKVCTCLNPLHTVLAIFGCLLGCHKISEEMQDADLKKLVEVVGYQEGLPVVTDPGILDPKEFIDTVLQIRFPNPFMPDTPQRIATDTSQKLAIRFGETIKAYGLKADKLQMIPLVFAGWLRYLLAIDDKGQPFTLSPDPRLDVLRPQLAGIGLGENNEAKRALEPIIKDTSIFGVDLYAVGLADTVYHYFCKMTAGTGAVRATLQEALSEIKK